jgi:hypothetical protein
MRLIVAILTLIGASEIAVADTPAPTPPPTPAPATAPTSAANPATPAASAPHDTGTTAAIDPREKMLKLKGYHVEMRNGEKMYCRSEEVLGSRVGGRKICGTLDALLEREHMSRELAESVQRQQLNPTGK